MEPGNDSFSYPDTQHSLKATLEAETVEDNSLAYLCELHNWDVSLSAP